MGKVIAFKELTFYKGDYQPELRADRIYIRRGAKEVPWGSEGEGSNRHSNDKQGRAEGRASEVSMKEGTFDIQLCLLGIYDMPRTIGEGRKIKQSDFRL